MEKSTRADTGSQTAEKGGTSSPALPAGRLGFSVAEFSAYFNHHHSWGYRQLYSGRVRKLDLKGRIIIPRSEIEHLLGQVTVHGDAAE